MALLTLAVSSNKISGPLSPLSAMAYFAGLGRGAPRNQEYRQHPLLNSGYSRTEGGLYDQMNAGGKMDVDVQDSQQLQRQRHCCKVDEEDGSFKDQNADLRAQILILESDAEAEQRALDAMLTELTSAQEELHNAADRFAAKESECADLRARLVQSDESGRNGTHPGGVVQSEIHGSMAEMQQQIDDLLGILRSKDILLSKQQAELADERSTRVQLAITCEKLAATQTRAPESIAPRQDAAPISEHHHKVEQLKENVRFFKANSERLGQIVRDLSAENHQLREDIDVKQRELKDERALNLALKMQAGST